MSTINYTGAIGLQDINGQEICSGDRVLAYPANYKIVGSFNPPDGVQVLVQEIDITAPPSVPDTPLFAGYVRWGPDQLAWEVDVHWCCSEWRDSGFSRIRMGGNAYVFEIISEGTILPA